MSVAEQNQKQAAPPARRRLLTVFDEHHPPSAELIGDCVHCGFCLPTCPTYRLWGQEADSPRGRIYLMKLGLEGEVAMDKSYVEHFDRCLGCMACLTSCPSGVQYEKLIEATRSQIERRFPRTLSETILRWMIFAIFPYPERLRALSIPLWLYQRSGMQGLVKRSGLMSLLPKRLKAMDDLMPPVALPSPLPRAMESAGSTFRKTPRLRVGMLLGCVQRVFFGDVNQATVRVLEAEGCQVIVPAEQGCCGALMTHAGEEASALDFARRTIDQFQAADVDVIAINAAGCGSAMKEYGHLLRDDPRYAARATAFAAKCRDISQILSELPPLAKRHALPLRVAYHDACHLQHAQRITAQPRELLRCIPQLELREIADSAICCGSAGIYNLLQPEAARELGAQKARNVIGTDADVVVSGNPGCSLQLKISLKTAGATMPVLHWIELMDASISGTIPSALRPFIRR
ncbi:MAG TPA: heterodisulfide reductase-related iron-sulfur binding cluster [Phycisphaerae bacterium]|jgi:glycolate oxidase iron-sulfur subunit